MIAFVAIVAAVAVLVLVLIGIYNRLVALRNGYQAGYAQIDVQLKRRYDLIPNLVDTAKGYLKHERQTLEAVTAARNAAAAAGQAAASSPGNPSAMQALIGAETMLTGTLGRFFGLMESYPELKANLTMGQLMEELTTTENRIAFARQAYNDAVMAYNTARETFPSVMMAGPMGFGPAALFQIEQAAQREAPKAVFP
jgi:LemA protein